EIAQTVAWLRNWRVEFALLHCVSSYPTPVEEAHLRWITELEERFAVVVGYSDHTCEDWAGALAHACGAAIIEKHLTHDRSAVGPDHAISADPAGLARYVRAVRLTGRMCGRYGKHVLPIERDVRAVSRQSVVLRRDLMSGEQIREADVTFRRPGTGIPAAQLAALVGRRVRRAVRAGTLLQWDMLADVA
ncbi:MAG: N-acetylneuraminate synthase family protein, partial [Phycisphaerae bacterium]|nr:N-acetylneuraminate synthase family protein [Phycisphaerae bacterium]MDW8262837.1 N-acetylneuraminate synthase family protein [Phycisphaerales bacterium]